MNNLNKNRYGGFYETAFFLCPRNSVGGNMVTLPFACGSVFFSL